MGDLISVCLKHNQLPPKKTKQKNSREHDNYRFPLILVLISEVTAHCWGAMLSIFGTTYVKASKERQKQKKKAEEIIKLLPDCLVGWVLSLERTSD